MPLVVLCGLPHSGKSATCAAIETELRARLAHGGSAGGHRAMSIVSVKDTENPGYQPLIFSNAPQEKEHRAFLRSRVQQLLRPDVVVILDSCNYIKGFRYRPSWLEIFQTNLEFSIRSSILNISEQNQKMKNLVPSAALQPKTQDPRLSI